jgi:hypothetical protein
VAPITHLYALEVASSCLLSISAVSSSYLFLQRAQAIYSGQKWLQRVFFISWLIVLGAGCLVPAGLHPSYIPGTYYYKDSGLATYIAAAPWAVFLFDTTVFIAISYKIAKEHSITTDAEERQTGWIRLLSGRKLPQISKAVLRGGQQYYLYVIISFYLVLSGCR